MFSPTLNIYLAESNVITTVGSVSEDVVLRTDAFQSIEKPIDERWKGRRRGIKRRITNLEESRHCPIRHVAGATCEKITCMSTSNVYYHCTSNAKKSINISYSFNKAWYGPGTCMQIEKKVAHFLIFAFNFYLLVFRVWKASDF